MGIGNLIEYLAVFINYGIPIIIIILVSIFFQKKFKYIEYKLNEIAEMLKDNKK